MTVMDQRIGDLRERLHKKRAEVQSAKKSGLSLSCYMSLILGVCVCPLQLSRMNGGTLSSPQSSSHPGAGVSGRVAAVCPYIQVPSEGRQEPGYPLPADPPPKPTPLSHIRSLSGWWMFILFLFFSPILSLCALPDLVCLYHCLTSNLLFFHFFLLSCFFPLPLLCRCSLQCSMI